MTENSVRKHIEAAKYILNSKSIRKKDIEQKFGNVGMYVFQQMIERRAIYSCTGLYGKRIVRIKAIIAEYEKELDEAKWKREVYDRQNIMNSIAAEHAKRTADATEELVKVAKFNRFFSSLSKFIPFLKYIIT